MQSSAAVVLRALLMLGCLIVIPLTALSGTSLPQLITTFVESHWPACLSAASGASNDAAGFEPAGPPDVATPAPPGQPPPNLPMEPPREIARGPHNISEIRPSAVTAAVYETPVGPGGGARPVAGSVAAATPSNPAIGQVPPAGDRPLPTPSTAAQWGGGQAVPLEQFTFIQERLRKLGATYYLLESWGNQQDLYRFYCKMAIGGNPNYTRHFEATNAEPLRAMALVLQQVEAWRNSRE